MKRHNPREEMPLLKLNRSPHALDKAKPGSTITLKKPRRDLSNRVYASEEARMNATKRANELESELKNGFPSFVKPLLQSHVTGGFWLGLPTQFCRKNLPKGDDIITLVDENGGKWPTVYLERKSGLSGGWRGFSIEHKLVDGDALVFELVKPKELKVYIVKASSMGSLTPYSCPEPTEQRKYTMTSGIIAKYSQETPLVATSYPLKEEKCEDETEEIALEVLEGIRFAEETIAFKDVKNLESFTIIVDGLIIDSEFSMITRTKYYNLCHSQDTFLHNNLLEGLNMKLAVGAIIETVAIADAIKASKLSTPLDDFTAWDKSLGALQMLGMNLAFLRARLQRLKNIVIESWNYYDDQIQASMAEIKTMIVDPAGRKRASGVLDSKLETMEAKARRYEVKFQSEVSSPL